MDVHVEVTDGRNDKRLVIASAATGTPMGAQVYQEEIVSRAEPALNATEPHWSVSRTIVRSLRSPLPGDVRLPMGLTRRLSPAARRELGRLIYRDQPTVVHRMDLELPPYAGRDVITLHDVVAWRFNDEAPPVPAASQEARQAAAVICVSNFTAQEAMDFLGIRNPQVVYNGVSPRFFDAPPLDESSLNRLGIHQPYVLTMGGASRRKNLTGLADAWPVIHASRPDLALVLAGPPHPRRTELFLGRTGVRLIGRVADDLVPGLVAAASVLLIPSLYEGFGLPALEGMAANVPVVAARTSALPEVVGDGGILVEPTGDELAEGTLWAASGDSRIGEIVRRGHARAAEFTWERSALGHARVWTSLL